MPPTRHFTATGFVVHEGRVLLHWHPKVQAWLPPGGHVHENEDPVQTVVREIEEEAGVRAEVAPAGRRFELEYPTQVETPFTIMVEDIHDPVSGYHQHIDMIYFCRLVGPPGPLNAGWRWVSGDDIAGGRSLEAPGVPPAPPPEDVRALAREAIRFVEP